MAGFICPFCQQMMVVNIHTYRQNHIAFVDNVPGYSDSICVEYYRCPNCDKTAIFVEGTSKNVNFPRKFLYPISSSTQFPDYIPLAIRKDYEEACSIVDLSPKASATL